jgi:hypothetical protein
MVVVSALSRTAKVLSGAENGQFEGVLHVIALQGRSWYRYSL